MKRKSGPHPIKAKSRICLLQVSKNADSLYILIEKPRKTTFIPFQGWESPLMGEEPTHMFNIRLHTSLRIDDLTRCGSIYYRRDPVEACEF